MGFILLAFRCCQHAQEQENKSVVKREGGNGRDPTLKNIGELMPAVKSRCWRENLKVVAQRTQTLLKDEEQWSCTCAHPERGEAEDRERQRHR
jgi:hypothetical protein